MFEGKHLFLLFVHTGLDALLYLGLVFRGLSDVVQLLINKGASFNVTDRVSYYFYLNNLNSASHFVLYFTVRGYNVYER